MDKESSINLSFILPDDDFRVAGEASSSVKKVLSHLGINPQIIRRTAIAMYEAEINAVIHAGGGTADVNIYPDRIVIKIEDKGPGIPDIDLAMQEGYSTASERIREMGFGAGMGLPNIKRYSDELQIDSKVGEGTVVKITVYVN
ncbi:MAG TPA: anti-sigma regulatory factor [Clostridiaceae bacterium]|nr:anti-sigma regulatory factor [Clostridiaceae bacterium]